MSKLHIKLDIQRFAAELWISASTLSQDVANNTSLVRINVTIHRTGGTTNWSKPYYRTLTFTCDGQTGTASTEFKTSEQDKVYTYDFTIPHNSDGTKYIEFSASLAATQSLPKLTASGSTWLTTIPRYTSTTNWSIASRTETSITLNWATANTCSQIRYGTSTSSYSTINVNSRSGQVTISGLTANTPYNLYFMPKRSDSGLWGNGSADAWSSTSQTTYDYPKIEDLHNFTIGSASNVVKINNPLNRSVTVTLNLPNSNSYTLATNYTYNGYMTTEFNTVAAITALYNSIPSARSGSYSCTVYCATTSTTKTSSSATFNIKNDGTENPTFDASNWSYVADLTSLTHNDQVVINGQSTLTFTVGTAAQAKYGASIKEYRFKWGNASKSSTIGYTVPQGNGNILTVEAIDTRELSTVTTKTLSSGVTYLPYLLPSLEYNFCNTHRTDGITAEVKLNLYGTLSLTKFGATGENNSISSAGYRVYDYDIADWTQYYSIPTTEFTYTNNTFRLDDYIIHANGSSGGFTVGKRYLIQIILKDGNNLLGTFTSQDLQITDGKISRDVYQDLDGDYHQGINGMADSSYTETIHGDINVVGDYYQNGQPFSGGGGGDTLPIGAIMPYGGSTIPENWLECNGQAVSRTTYSDLFNVIGTAFGSGDGSTTFNLPNFNGRSAIGYNSSDSDFNAIGKTYGNKSINYTPQGSNTGGSVQNHTLTANQSGLPWHVHTINTRIIYCAKGSSDYWHVPYGPGTQGTNDVNGNGGWNASEGHNHGFTNPTFNGTQASLNVVHPVLVTKYIIKVAQSAGIMGTVSNTYSDSSISSYSCNYINRQKETYSTTEEAIGTWIDGKTIYRKVLNATLPSSAYSNAWTYLVGISNVSKAIKIYGIMSKSDGDYPLPRYESNSYLCSFRYYNGNIEVLGAGWNGQAVSIIVEYTKSS